MFNCIDLHQSKQGTRSAEAGALAPVCEKSDTDPRPKQKPKLLRFKSIVNIVSTIIKIISTVNQLPDLTASIAEHNKASYADKNIDSCLVN